VQRAELTPVDKESSLKMKGQRPKPQTHQLRRSFAWGITVLALVFSLDFAFGPHTATDALGISTDILISGLIYGGLEYLVRRS
jgi:hypothetical protein